jgi:probable addiction module antidote protein
MPIETRPFDAAEYLDSPEGIEEYLIAAFETEDPAEIADALGVVAKAKGMSQLAQETGISRGALYKALRPEGNPEFATIVGVVHALGFRLKPERALEEVEA